MPIVDFNIDLFQDYLETLCQRSKLVQHKIIVPPAKKAQRTFARFESEEHIGAIKSCAGKNIVVVADYYGQRVGDADDQRLRITVSIRFAAMKVSGTKDETDAINTAIKTAEDMMFQFIAMMEKDFREGCNALETLEPERLTWNRIEEQPWLQDYYGWDLNISFGSYMPEHNEDNWEEA
jgi:hypothetical protein